MDGLSRTTVAIVAVAALIAVAVLSGQRSLAQRWNKGSHAPPGPPGHFLLGNLPDIPKAHSWLKFKEWSDRYGPIFRLNLAGRNHIVISKEKIANDLLRERGAIYSSREHLTFATGLLSNNLRPVLLPYNDLWRRGRKLMHHLAMPAMAETYEPVQHHESLKLLRALIAKPSDYDTAFGMYASGVVFRVGFGRWLESGEESEFKRIMKVNHELERTASPGAYLVDSIPVLNYLPSFLAPWKQEGKRLHEEEIGLFRELQDGVRRALQQDKYDTQSFTRTFLEEQSTYQLSDDEGAYVVGTLFEAGSGTTAAAMMSFCLAMCHSPEWQAKMQAEVDRQAGDRLPEFSDLPNLPTVRAVIKEVLRWRPVTAGGLPHQLTKDDMYEEYFFPAGTVVHPNQWAIHRDPELYPDPEEYKPERWLEPTYPTYREPLTKFPNLQNYSCFGFGRRICPGQHITERSLHILTARIAWAVNMNWKRDASGQPLTLPLYDYTSGFNTQPKHFDFDIVPRSAARADQLQKLFLEQLKSRPR